MEFNSPAQWVGYAALAVGIFAFMQRDDDRLRFFSATMCLLYSLHFALLGNPVASVGTFISAVRSLVAIWWRNRWLAALFVALNVALGGWLATEWRHVIPIVGSVAGTLALFLLQGLRMRLLLLTGTVCWLTNNVLSGSIGGTLLEGTIFITNSTTILRLWWRERDERRLAAQRGATALPASGRRHDGASTPSVPAASASAAVAGATPGREGSAQ
ncbi:YgjV family protein [Derxia gummosa]|uniref:YgjV family protein n=1 Tax=Derxia gummosa DSM 723 TaxID=1121388 RepID=A0A8B6XAU3_9BURK|nr:YgjV family protein [Derxia gummosa]